MAKGLKAYGQAQGVELHRLGADSSCYAAKKSLAEFTIELSLLGSGLPADLAEPTPFHWL